MLGVRYICISLCVTTNGTMPPIRGKDVLPGALRTDKADLHTSSRPFRSEDALLHLAAC